MIHKEQALKKGIKIIDSKEAKNALFENLKTHFPQTIKDNQIDLHAIATLLGLETKANIQGYELTFTGKALANALYSTPTQKLLKFEESFNVRNAESSKEDSNFIIKGDNLDVLKILKSAYSEKIKMIYIDPPYNTKNDNFIYPDNFRKDYKAILQEVGLLEIDDKGNEVESETLQFFKNIQSTRTHSGWLSFMLPRLKLARDLLREDGVIFISIDDNEQANLKILCDEIFGEENFCGQIVWQTATDNNPTQVATEHEYVLCYAKSITEQDVWEIDSEKAGLIQDKYEELKKQNIDLDELSFKLKAWIRQENGNLSGVSHYCYVDEQGVFYPGNSSNTKPGGYTYDIIHPITKKICAKPEYGYRFKEETFLKALECGDVLWGEDETIIPKIKKRLETAKEKLKSSYYEDNRKTTKELVSLMGGKKVFNNPKSTKFISKITNFITTNDNCDIVLDFFAGSGTTAQAVMELNVEDKGNRKFILVQIDEPINESKNKVAYDFCKNELKSKNPAISDITIERVKRASAKIANANPNFSVSFSVLALSDKPELISTKKGTLELLSNTDLSPFDKALNLALQSGKTLDKPLKTIFENRLYQCEDCLYLIACDKEVLEFLRKTQNEYIFIDGFEDINLEDFLNLDSSLNDRLRVVY